MRLDNTVIQFSIQRLACTGCGAEANASCDCGLSYVPKAVRAAEAVRANPEKSDRAIAAELGVGRTTVQRAREELAHDGPVEDGPRIGRDGKARRLPQRRVEDEFDEDLAFSQTKDAFIARAAEAEADAMYVGKIDEEVILAAEETAAAWCQLVSELKGKSQ